MATRLTTNTVAHPDPLQRERGHTSIAAGFDKKARPAKPDALAKAVYSAVPYVEYLNSGIAFNSSLVALKRA